jgi:hypothetical protein
MIMHFHRTIIIHRSIMINIGGNISKTNLKNKNIYNHLFLLENN